MKIAVLTVTYRDDRFIKECAEQFDERFYHLFLVNKYPWNWKREPMDNTVKILKKLKKDYLFLNKCTQEEARNYGLDSLKYFDWVLIVDADEHYSQKSLDNLYEFLKTADKPAYHISRYLTYWFDKHHVVYPAEHDWVTVVVKPHLRFISRREVNSEKYPLPANILLHHYSYVRSNKEMERKIRTFSHSVEMVPFWYENKWLGWQKDHTIKNLHPVKPELFRSIKRIRFKNKVHILPTPSLVL